ncbi:MAG: nucleoside transporter C-terminal domain-containing protein [bacterium]|nr:nucleoside transporter C-terminal domain-containing protein [bacterium]
MQNITAIMGLFMMLCIAFLLSTKRKAVSLRIILWGTGLQFFFAFLILPNSPFNRLIKHIYKTERAPGEILFAGINQVIVKLLSFTEEGARFVFGGLVNMQVPVGSIDPATNQFAQHGAMVANTGSYFAFNVLPTIIFFSGFMAVLYYLGVMQKIVLVMARFMTWTMKTSGAESLSAAANIFVGQTEAPLVVKPYVEKMTFSELMAVMTGGMATVAGGVMAAYVGMLYRHFPSIAGHLMAASIMSAPAALVMAKILVPETEQPKTAGKVELKVEKQDTNVIDALARGSSEGLFLALNVGAMLIAFLALIALLNYIVLKTCGFTVQDIFGWVCAPLAYMMGVPWKDCTTIGILLGEKVVLNEFVAYLHLANILNAKEVILSERSIVIATYALCGFANFGSIGIQLGGIGGIAPSRRGDLAKLGLRSVLGGSFAAFMTAIIAGIFM